ncbi:hypothetical protein SDC9_119467 [bioreactor metagenome]|uniref:Uncharacterized protein n=1 Tax=bioreactor metagenome TaxID=1076179 RepID=A0A645C668_9ZZZZ
MPFLTQAPENDEQTLHLLWRKDGGRFIQNNKPGVAVEYFHDLHPLLLAYREGTHQCSRVYGEVVAFAQGADAAIEFLRIDERIPFAFKPEGNVLAYGKGGHQRKVLVHHPDLQRNGILGTLDAYRFPVKFNTARICLIDAVKNVHQGGLTRPVLSKQGMNLPLFQGEIHLFIGHLAKELLVDFGHPQRRHVHSWLLRTGFDQGYLEAAAKNLIALGCNRILHSLGDLGLEAVVAGDVNNPVLHTEIENSTFIGITQYLLHGCQHQCRHTVDGRSHDGIRCYGVLVVGVPGGEQTALLRRLDNAGTCLVCTVGEHIGSLVGHRQGCLLAQGYIGEAAYIRFQYLDRGIHTLCTQFIGFQDLDD